MESEGDVATENCCGLCGRCGSDGKKLVDAVKAEVNKENSLRLKVLVAGQVRH